MQANLTLWEINLLARRAEVDGVTIAAVEDGDDDALPPPIIVERVYVLTDEEAASRFSRRNWPDEDEVDGFAEGMVGALAAVSSGKGVELDKEATFLRIFLGGWAEDGGGVPRATETLVLQAHFHLCSFLEGVFAGISIFSHFKREDVIEREEGI